VIKLISINEININEIIEVEEEVVESLLQAGCCCGGGTEAGSWEPSKEGAK